MHQPHGFGLVVSVYLLILPSRQVPHTPARPVPSFRIVAQSHSRIGHTYRFLHGSGSTCFSTCGWSDTSVPCGLHDRTPLPAWSSTLCRIPAICLSELVITPTRTRPGPPPWPLPISGRDRVFPLRLERSMTETFSRPVFLRSPLEQSRTTGHRCTLRGEFFARPARLRRRAERTPACLYRYLVPSAHR